MANSEYYKNLALNGLKYNLRYDEYILKSLPRHYELEMKLLIPKMKKFNRKLLDISNDMVESYGIQYPMIYESTRSIFYSKHKDRWDILTVGGADTNGLSTILTYNPITEKMIVQDENGEILNNYDTILSALKMIVEYQYNYLNQINSNPEMTKILDLFNKIII